MEGNIWFLGRANIPGIVGLHDKAVLGVRHEIVSALRAVCWLAPFFRNLSHIVPSSGSERKFDHALNIVAVRIESIHDGDYRMLRGGKRVTL